MISHCCHLVSCAGACADATAGLVQSGSGAKLVGQAGQELPPPPLLPSNHHQHPPLNPPQSVNQPLSQHRGGESQHTHARRNAHMHTLLHTTSNRQPTFLSPPGWVGRGTAASLLLPTLSDFSLLSLLFSFSSVIPPLLLSLLSQQSKG